MLEPRPRLVCPRAPARCSPGPASPSRGAGARRVSRARRACGSTATPAEHGGTRRPRRPAAAAARLRRERGALDLLRRRHGPVRRDGRAGPRRRRAAAGGGLQPQARSRPSRRRPRRRSGGAASGRAWPCRSTGGRSTRSPRRAGGGSPSRRSGLPPMPASSPPRWRCGCSRRAGRSPLRRAGYPCWVAVSSASGAIRSSASPLLGVGGKKMAAARPTRASAARTIIATT